MARDWQDISVTQDDIEKTPCDCCGKTTLMITGDLYCADDWIAFYWIRFTEAHPDVPPQFSVGTGDRSEAAAPTDRWVFGAEVDVAAEGFRLLDMARDSTIATYLNRNDILGTDFAEDAFAMLDAILLKDDRLREFTS